MKKLLAGLFLVGSVLSFGAQRMQVEKMVMNGDLFYVQGEQKPYSGEIEKKYPNGKTLGLATIKAGKLEGKVYEYYENGKLQAEGTYKNGEVDGVATTYDENGKILQQVTYKNGKEVK